MQNRLVQISYISLLIVSVIWLTQCNNPGNAKSRAALKSGYKIVGYVAGWSGMEMQNIDANKLTHINYAFADIDKGKIVMRLKTDSLNLVTLVGKKAQNPDLKVIISIGGWAWSNWFSDAALTPESRSEFAGSAINLMQKYRLDGIDLDWEYPGQIGEDNGFRPEDKQNFTLLLKEIRRELDELGAKSDKHFLLTIATGGDQAYIDHTELGETQKYLDFINIMTYDFYSGLDSTTGHHANLNDSKQAPTLSKSVQASVERHLTAGVPANKIVLGIPFYGRMWKGVTPQDNGLYKKAKSVGMIVDYKIITDKYMDKGFKRFWDESAKAPYLWSRDSCIFISYEDTTSLALKLHFVEEKGLGGAMFWEYSLDKNGELLNTINKYLKR
jgi:chitinase